MTSATRVTNPQVMFLGRALTGGDIEDVDSTDVVDRVPRARPDAAPDATPNAAGRRVQSRNPLSDRSSHRSSSCRVTRAWPLRWPRPSSGRRYRKNRSPIRQQAAIVENPQSAEVQALTERTQTPPTVTLKVADLPEQVIVSHRAGRTHDAGRSQDSERTRDSQRMLPPPSDSVEESVENEDAVQGLVSGRPELVSAESLPEFKRILTVADDDAALRIPAGARKEFVAVELQPGIAITVATARFAEKAQYATFIKDLGTNDILVREEMIAAESVIAAIYSGKTASAGKSTVREASRAIGNFRDIVEAAHAYGASDIHFEPREFHNDVEVRFRVNGDMYTYRHMPKAIVRRALFAAYSDLVQRNTNSGNSFQPSAPQSAMIPLVVKTDTVNLRWQSSPLVGGYDVTLRLLDGNFKNYSVLLPKDMGLEKSQLELIETLNYVSGGITALTGETGSGKTTTLRALSYMLPDREMKKQFAVNEPSEYPMPWLSDYSIIRRPDETDDEANRKYAEVIRTLMRQDPDDLTIGEVRDRVVMGLVAELALTGHPVRFSLHAGDIIAAVMRMAGGRLQLPIDELASEGFINAVGNQKLIATLCEHCKLPAQDVMAPKDLEILRDQVRSRYLAHGMP